MSSLTRLTSPDFAGPLGSSAVGPGSVNLLTGALDLSATDAAAFGVSISRTASSRRTNAGAENVAGSPFGPQWVLGGVDDDLDLSWTSIRQTSDYSLDVLDASGESTSFVVDEAGTTWYAESGEEDLTLVGSTTVAGVDLALTPFKATSWTLTDGDGTVTVFGNRVAITAPANRQSDFIASANTQASWQATSIAPANGGAINATRYGYTQVKVPDRNDTSKMVDAWRLSRVGAANPALSASAQGTCLTAATPGPGCRVLQLNWNGNDASARVNSIDLYATDPTAPTATPSAPVQLATYLYDAANRLASVTDRAGLITTYTYRADYSSKTGSTPVTVPGPVATVTPAKQKAWTFTYGEVESTFDTGQAGSQGRLLTVSRPTVSASDGTTATGTASWDVVYSVPLDVTRMGPYPMSARAVLTWGQDVAPLDATAVYGPNAADVPDSRVGVHDAAVDTTARNWTAAAVSYMDVNGHTVNVAQPSALAGRWVGSGTWNEKATTAANLAAISATTVSTRNGAGQPGAGLPGGSSPAAGEVPIPVKGARISAAIVDAAGNTTFSLTPANRALALGQDDEAAKDGGAGDATTQLGALSSTSSTPDVKGSPTWLRAQLLSTQTRYELSRSTFTAGPQLREPTQVAVTSLQPLRLTMTQPASDGSPTPVPARAVTYTEYDAGRPASGAQASELPTKVTTGFVAGTTELLDTKQVIRYRDPNNTSQPWQLREENASYAGVSGLTIAKLRPLDGGGAVHDVRYVDTEYAWTGAAAGKPVWVRTSAATGDATETRTAYDALGRVIAASMPRNPGDTSATGTASTTVTRYYGDGTNGTNNCTTATSAAAVVFAGMVCSTGPANVQVGGSAGLPTSTTTYTRTGLPATVTETLTPYGSGTNSTLRATINGYDGADRPTSVRTTTYGALNVTAGTEVKTLTYDEQGNPDSTSDGGSSNVPNGRTLRTTYDTLGRVTSSLEATGLKTQTTYDTSGRVATTTITDTNTSPANTGAAAVTGYSPVTAGKVWKQTNSYDPITGDLTGTWSVPGFVDTGLSCKLRDLV
ncbi:hypothetical protein AB2L27_20060 [Kineococcus sp. LSe6-4]|uniref:YD repeat-containing protein n=1 Tax=Kineococcus halophytocola TaxID=3234027 RepID=A0ABV4H640_9ACTN